MRETSKKRFLGITSKRLTQRKHLVRDTQNGQWFMRGVCPALSIHPPVRLNVEEGSSFGFLSKALIRGKGARSFTRRRSMRFHCKCIGIAIGIQLLAWILLYGLAVALPPSFPMDGILEGFVRIYYPLVKLVGRLGSFKGDQNILMPILLGVPLGTILYGVFFGVVIGYLKRVNELPRNTRPPV